MKMIIVCAAATFATVVHAPAYAAVTYQRASNLIHVTGADYQNYRRTGVVQPVFIGQQTDHRPPYAVRDMCAYQLGGSGSGYGDNGREVYLLAHTDWCRAPRAPRVLNCDAIVPGSWNWSFGSSRGAPPVSSGSPVDFKSDGSMTWRGKSGHWSCHGMTVTLDWAAGDQSSRDTMTLGNDERFMIGTNNNGVNVRGDR